KRCRTGEFYLGTFGDFSAAIDNNDLIPFNATTAERDRIVREFKQALHDYGMVVPMATTNLFFHPIFKDGAFTSVDPSVRAFALQKTMRAIDLGVELGASTYVFWGGREGVESEASKGPLVAVKRMRDALNFLSHYVLDQGYHLRFALEPKPNEPRADTYFPTIGHMLAFIYTLDRPEMVGLNPEVAHEHMAGLNCVHGVAQALEAGKLFHIDLNDQKGCRYDQDLRFGSENIKSMFFLVRLLENAGYTGPRHFDAHAYRTEDEQGVWDFALGCMRTYIMLKAKARRFDADPEVQALLRSINSGNEEHEALLSQVHQGYKRELAQKLRETVFEVETLARRGYSYEKLDQLTIEHILGTH
ncbi:MAG: xylose isomerase, partial [Ktedonobacteraceae bacterium]